MGSKKVKVALPVEVYFPILKNRMQTHLLENKFHVPKDETENKKYAAFTAASPKWN